MSIPPVKHRLSLEWSRETGVESSSTGTCLCGWTESASSQKEVRAEYRHHLASFDSRRCPRCGRRRPEGGPAWCLSCGHPFAPVAA